ncbi:Transducin (beta)-like 3 [Nowakowskiella sp. JEL0078]|nr:Transducin (beta)-like 3 [Nowakowskiella sp. JEL0078]
MDIDPSSTLVATGSADSTVKVWNLEKGFATHNFKKHGGIISAVKFHHDVKKLQLATASDDCRVLLWDLKTSSCIATLNGHASVVRSLTFTTEGKFLLSGGRDKVMNAWNLQTFALSKTLLTLESVEAAGIVQSSLINGGESSAVYVYTGGDKGLVKVWDLAKDKCIMEKDLGFGKQAITDLMISPFDNQLVAVMSDSNIVFLNIETGLQRQRTIAGYNDEIVDVKFMGANDDYLAVATNSEQV